MEMGGKRKTYKPKPVPLSQVAEDDADYQSKTPQQIEMQIQQLETQMYEAAKNLEFEQAAGLRDQISTLREIFIQNS